MLSQFLLKRETTSSFAKATRLAMPVPPGKQIFFSTFKVTNQVFYLTPLSYALVNLKPLVPGHVLVCPVRVTPRYRDLSTAEITDLFKTVQRVARMIERVFDAPAVNIAIQDGREAGQTVPHLHCHILPRKRDDFGGVTDKVYELLESDEADLARHLDSRQQQRRHAAFPKVDDADRAPRGEEEMRSEAEWLSAEMEKDNEG